MNGDLNGGMTLLHKWTVGDVFCVRKKESKRLGPTVIDENDGP